MFDNEMDLYTEIGFTPRRWEKGGGGDAAGAASQTAANTAQQSLNQILQLINTSMGNFGNTLGPTTQATGNDFLGQAQGAGANTGGIMQLFQMLGIDPKALAGATGIDAPGLTSGAIGALSNPGATNMNSTVLGTHPEGGGVGTAGVLQNLGAMGGALGGGTAFTQQAPSFMNQMLSSANPTQQAGGAATGGLSEILSQLPGLQSALSGAGEHATAGLSAPTSLQSAAPGALSFFQNQMQHGIDPTFATNAQSQLQQQFAQSMSDIKANAAPGQNINAAERSAQNSLLSNSTNLAGNLAGQSQTLAGQGAQGAVSTAGALDQQTIQSILSKFGIAQGVNQAGTANAGQQQSVLDSMFKVGQGETGAQQSAIQGAAGIGQAAGAQGQAGLEGAAGIQQALPGIAGGLDSQSIGMLLQAAGLGSGYNQQQLGNVGAAGQAGQSSLAQIMQFLGLGQNANNSALGALSGVNQTANNNMFQFANLANQQNQQSAAGTSGMLTSLLGMGAGAMTGGAAGAGGLGSILLGLSDERFKKDIVPVAEPVPGIKIVNFTWRASGERDTGVIAQDLKKRHPDLVVEGVDGFLRVKYGRIVEVLTNEIQRLRQIALVPACA